MFQGNNNTSDSTSTPSESTVINKEAEAPPLNLNQLKMDEPKSWIVVVASFILHFILLGIQYTFGVYLVYYLEKDFKGQTTKSVLSLVGSISTCIMSAGGIFAGPLTDKFGYRTMALVGNFLFALGLLLASFSIEVWHLFLTQGVIMGIGSSIAFFPAVSISSQYFDKYRGLATGICVAGSGVGGLALSPITQLLLDKLGFRWSLRIMALFSLVAGSLSGFFIRERLRSKRKGKFIDFTIFKDIRFIALVTGGFISSLGYLVPFFVMPLYASACNIDAAHASILLGLLNGGNALGRVVLGFLADRAGRLNVMAIGIFATGLFCLVIWIFSSTFAPLLVFCILYGIAAGAFISLLPVTSAFLFGLDNIASINGLLYVANGIPNLIGTPLATALIGVGTNSEGPTSYLPVILFAGISGIAGSFFIFWLRFIVDRNPFKIL